MRPVWYPVLALVAVIVAFAALNPINGTRGSCDGARCSIVLDGIESEVNVLGQDITFYGADGNLARFGVGGRSYGCIGGETVTTPAFDVTCTAVGSDIMRADVVRDAL